MTDDDHWSKRREFPEHDLAHWSIDLLEKYFVNLLVEHQMVRSIQHQLRYTIMFIAICKYIYR